MVSAIAGFADLIRDLGLSFAIVQAPRLSSAQASSLFWVSSSFGLVLAAIFTLIRVPISEFYGQGQVAEIVPIVSLSIFAASLGGTHIALLDRALGFTRVMISDLISATVACTTAIVLAALGFGIWSLVAMNLSQALLRTILAWINVPWRPGRPSRLSEVSHLLDFGAKQFGAQVLNYSSRNVDNILVGRLFGARVLGQYAQAYQLLLLPIQQINAPLQRVAIPLLSRARDDPKLFREYFQMAIRVMGLLLIPMFVVGSIISHDLVVVVLGQKWAGTAPIFSILCIAGCTQSLGYATSWLFVSTGRSGRQLIYALVSRPVVIASFFIGAQWGVRGLAWGYALTSVAVLPFAFMYAASGTPIRLGRLLLGLPELLPMILIVAVPTWWCNHYLHAHAASSLVTLGASVLTALCVYVGCWVFIPSCRRTFKTFKRYARRS